MSEELIKINPNLKLVRGYYYCPIWNLKEQHWWTVDENGNINDPTKEQFPSIGNGIYEEFDGICECSECGSEMPEEKAIITGRYALCSNTCYGRFVGAI